jgi:hypothetical protein
VSAPLISFTIPIFLPSLTNARDGHWRVRLKRSRLHRLATMATWAKHVTSAGCLTMLGFHALIAHDGQTLVAGIEIVIGFCLSMAADLSERMPS